MNSAIIVAGGTGTRMKSEVPKQFLLLDGKPMLFYPLSVLSAYDADMNIILVLPENFISHWKSLVKQFSVTIPHKIVLGGQTRFHSVKNGVSALGKEGFVAVHDGARPLITTELTEHLFNSAFRNGNAVPSLPVNESIRFLESEKNIPVNRENYRLIQTPQVFKISAIREAYQQEYRESFTDDATVIESYGEKINLVEGDPFNLKVTTTHDLALADFLIKTRKTIY